MLLVNLPNAKGRKDCELFHSVAKAFAILRRGLAATAASDNGAINLWYDDGGNLRGQRMRFMVSQDLRTFKNQKEAGAGLKDALVAIQ